MATTLTNVQAAAAYRETRDQIFAAMNTLKAQLVAHEHAAQAIGTDWGHVGDLTEVLALLQRAITHED